MNLSPMFVVELDLCRRDKLLQSPTSSEPPAPVQASRCLGMCLLVDICQPDVANLGHLVPPEHGVDSFRQLGAARLVDAAGVDPCVLKFRYLPGPSAGFGDFGVPFHLGCRRRGLRLGKRPRKHLPEKSFAARRRLSHGFKILERDLVVVPCVGKNGEWRRVVRIEEPLQLHRVGIDKPHLS